MTLYDNEAIKARVNLAWERVFQASSKIIADANLYGFHAMEIIPNPNIHQMLLTLRGLGVLMTLMIDHEIFAQLDYDEARLLLNAREQLQRMERAAIALKAEDEVGFNEAIGELERQAPF